MSKTGNTFAWIASNGLSETVNAFNRLLHSDWYGYYPKTWASNGCLLFADPNAFPNDDRAKLTWRGRFASVGSIMYNFWSSGDEVLEISDSDVSLLSGIEFDWKWKLPFLSVNPRRYVWHKQARFKGRSSVYGTDWAGWSFWKTKSHSGNLIQVYSQNAAN